MCAMEEETLLKYSSQICLPSSPNIVHAFLLVKRMPAEQLHTASFFLIAACKYVLE